MAGAAEVVEAVGEPEGVVRAALVPNVRGAEMALAAGVDELTVTISASAVYNERNVKMTIDDSVEQVQAICALAAEAGVPVGVNASPMIPFINDHELEHILEAARDVGAVVSFVVS